MCRDCANSSDLFPTGLLQCFKFTDKSQEKLGRWVASGPGSTANPEREEERVL
jgi:hypothetical protein